MHLKPDIFKKHFGKPWVVTQEEYDNAMKVSYEYSKQGYVCEWAEHALLTGTKEMQDALIEHASKHNNIIDYIFAVHHRSKDNEET